MTADGRMLAVANVSNRAAHSDVGFAACRSIASNVAPDPLLSMNCEGSGPLQAAPPTRCSGADGLSLGGAPATVALEEGAGLWRQMVGDRHALARTLRARW